MANENAESWRVFCAIDLPESVRGLMAKHISKLRSLVPEARVRWSRPENIHLTLKFLGDVPITQIATLRVAASSAVEDLTRFEIRIGAPGTFLSKGSPGVLWIGVEDSGRLAKLHARLEDECATLGFEKETRSFKPHLTLARLRGADYRGNRREDIQASRRLAAAHEALQLEKTEITVDELLVIRSELGPAGSRYTVLSRHALARPNT